MTTDNTTEQKHCTLSFIQHILHEVSEGNITIGQGTLSIELALWLDGVELPR